MGKGEYERPWSHGHQGRKREPRQPDLPLVERLRWLAKRYEEARASAARAKAEDWPSREKVRQIIAAEFAAALKEYGAAFHCGDFRYFYAAYGASLELTRCRMPKFGVGQGKREY